MTEIAPGTSGLDELRVVVCKECNAAIDGITGLCGLGCKHDKLRAEHRSSETVEVRIFRLDRIEPYRTRNTK